jgi:hypothetical protein
MWGRANISLGAKRKGAESKGMVDAQLCRLISALYIVWHSTYVMIELRELFPRRFFSCYFFSR